MDDIEKKILNCKRCNYKWVGRVKKPVECPNCKSLRWWETPSSYIIRRTRAEELNKEVEKQNKNLPKIDLD